MMMLFGNRLEKLFAIFLRVCERGIRVVLWVCFVLLAMPGCRSENDAEPMAFPVPKSGVVPVVSFGNTDGTIDYVGDEACESCHEEEFAGFREHGMAHSFYKVTLATNLHGTRTPIHDAETGYEYVVFRGRDGWYQQESLRAADGTAMHTLRRRMDYAMGSGHAARTFMSSFNGRLFELPLTWYTQKKKWDFSPGYKVHNGRFDRLIGDRCMACHNSYPSAVPFTDGKYTSLPEGIGCERCHGPGALHIEERLSDPDFDRDVDPTIVNPAHLPFEQRLDVCRQCHFSATVMVLRNGRSAFDFLPSEKLSDHIAAFVAPSDNEAGVGVISHADRMRRSRCFLGSLNAPHPLECVTCHNPHEGFRDKGSGYFNGTCLKCHSGDALRARALTPEHTPASNCIACHMPRVEAEDAPHASFTDHWIRVVRDSPPPASVVSSDPLVPYFSRDVKNRTGQAYLGMALVMRGRQSNDLYMIAQGAATLEVALKADTTLGEGYFLLGIAHKTLGEIDRAVPPLEHAFRMDPGSPQRLDALAQVYTLSGRGPGVIERLYRQALRIQPASAEVRDHYGSFLLARGQAAAAARAFRGATDERPTFDPAFVHLGLALTSLDSLRAAATAFQEALRLNPLHAETINHLFVVEGVGKGHSAVRRWTPFRDLLLTDAQGRSPIRLMVDADASRIRFEGMPNRAALTIYSDAGALIRSLRTGEMTWDLRDAQGEPAASGVYLSHVRAPTANGRPGDARVYRFALVRK